MKDVVNGQPCWVADLPDVRAGQWRFHQLWIDGQRRPRARHPNQGLLTIESVPGADPNTPVFTGQDRFVFARGDFAARENLEDVDVVVLHYWIGERLAVRGLDEPGGTVRFVRPARMRLFEGHGGGSPQARYYVENSRELLDAPGEWYLDRKAGRLTYLPRPSESPAKLQAIAPVLPQLLRLEGHPEAKRYVEHITLRGLTFCALRVVAGAGRSGR